MRLSHCTASLSIGAPALLAPAESNLSALLIGQDIMQHETMACMLYYVHNHEQNPTRPIFSHPPADDDRSEEL